MFLSFHSIYAQSDSWKKALRPLCARRRCRRRVIPEEAEAEAIGVRAHVSWHTFAVPHPAQSSVPSEHCHVFFAVHMLLMVTKPSNT